MNYDDRWLGSPMQIPHPESRSRHRSTRSDAGRHLAVPGTPLATPLGSGPPSPLSPVAGVGVSMVPRLRQIQNMGDLAPRSPSKGRFRRVAPEGGYVSPLSAMTTSLATTYRICDPNYAYRIPQKALTTPHVGKHNNGYDNEDSDYILWVNDVLGVDESRRYLVLGLLGKGTFGQVVKCQNLVNKEIVAVKVIKNKPAYLNQSMMEVSILEHIQQHVDKSDQYNILSLKDKFFHKEHLCLVFEILSINLYELISKNHFRGLGIRKVRTYTAQILDVLRVLKDARLIHCDLKPENILLRLPPDVDGIKVIDFGSACHERQSVYTYIQSRFYRSPEVMLGLPYTSSIDMWSLGCIVAELFLGLPIFPGTGEYNQWYRIVETLGPPPNWMLEMGKNTNRFMKSHIDQYGQKWYRLRSIEEQVAEFGTDEKPMRRFFNSTDLREIILSYPLLRDDMTQKEIDHEMLQRESLVDFIQGLLNFNPFERWTPRQAMGHPFITGAPYTGPYVPVQDPRNMPPQGVPFPQTRPTTQQYEYSGRGRRVRSATIGQPEPVPRPLQQAAAMVHPGDTIAAQPSPAYVPPPELYKNH